ncbi:MAG: TlpA family protein disulfide reductase [Piscirickettsiaceae bacterium]|nr:TlpA family protein disulfide reductase [Piscirickettsiaceae bacterium]
MSMFVSANHFKAEEGQQAADFEIRQTDGSIFKLSDYHGKQAVYLVFWNTWCGYCIKEIPKLKNVQADFSDDIKIIAINTSRKDSVEKMMEFKQKRNINYALAFDHDEKITDLYSVWGTPTEFIIDINGVIQYRDRVPMDIRSLVGQWNTSCDQQPAQC